MKQSVDLTLNRDFLKRPNRRSLKGFFDKYDYPWGTKKDILGDYKDSWLYEAIITGDKALRKEKRKYIEHNTGLTCECCGASLANDYPWERTGYLLCLSCDNGLIFEEREKLWGDYSPNRNRYAQKKDLPVISLDDIVFDFD